MLEKKSMIDAVIEGKPKKRRTSGLRPCFKRFAEEGGKISPIKKSDHILRLALVTEAHYKGYHQRAIYRLFEKAPDFSLKTTKTQVDWQLGKIARSGIKPYTCEAIAKHQGCLGEICKLYAPQILGEKDETFEEKKEALLSYAQEYFKFITPDDVEFLYFYDDGFYRRAEATMKSYAESIYQSKNSTKLCYEYIEHLKRRSHIKRRKLNAFGNILPVTNGLLNLKDFMFEPHTSEKYFTYKIDVVFDQTKICPKFLGFINAILPNKKAEQQCLQEYAGYTLLARFPYHKFMIMVGSGRNGKGAFIRTLQGILGDRNCSGIKLESLDGSERFAVANLYGIMMNVCSEPSTKHPFKTELFKKLNGQDMISGEVKNKQDPINWTSFTKFYILANKLPKVDDKTISFWDRVLILKFEEEFLDSIGNRIVDVEDAWLNDEDERSGILNWMILGLMRLLKNDGFTKTQSMKESIILFQQLSDPVGAFVTEKCAINPSNYIDRNSLYEAFKEYCAAFDVETIGQRTFFRNMRELPRVTDANNVKKTFKGKQLRVFTGIDLTENKKPKPQQELDLT